MTEAQTTRLHKILAFPVIIMFSWGFVIGLIVSPFIGGLRRGYKITEDFWNGWDA
jgi:hypothetical protein